MTALSAARPTVTVLTYEGMAAFELGIVTEVFGRVWPDFDAPWYELTICAERPGAINMIGGATLWTPHGLDTFAAAHTVIVPGVADPEAEPSADLIAALRLAHQRGARIVSICSGAFPLAAAGLLDGRTATTHWRYSDLLQRKYPAVRVDPNPLYIDNDDVLTSAGSAAGIDLALHIVRKDFGGDVANTLARKLVVYPHRDGGQAQFIEAAISVNPADDPVGATMRWALEHLAEPISVECLARMATMSTRTYLRRFARCTGTSPMKWLIAQRIQASLPLLETTSAPIDEIASAVGFETAVTYRHHFTKAMRTSPSAYRRCFHSGDTNGQARVATTSELLSAP